MENDFVDLILKFLSRAGKIALKYQDNLKTDIKPDKSIVTDADIAISKIFAKTIKKFLNSGEHALLDEENLPNIGNFFRNKTKFIWTLDPIDGTAAYFHGLPMWAVAVSLFEDFKPRIGAIYLPTMGELIYTDGKKTFYATNAFKKNEIRSEVKIRPDELTSKSIVLQHKLNVNEKEKTSRLLLDFYSSYVLGFYTLLGRSSGAFFNRPMKLWDITATLPIAKNLGMRFVDLESGKNVEQLSEDMVDENWYFRTTYLLCKNSDFDSLKVIYGGK